MGMKDLLGELYTEDTVLLTADMLANIETINQTREHYAQYLSQQRFLACRAGIPYVVEDRVYDPTAWIGSFLNDLPVEAQWFYYMDMSLRHDISKWNWSFPELGEARTLYIKCSRGINWNDFLASIWDFTKNNLKVVLLDCNGLLRHGKHQKILRSLILRGVKLGFHGEFHTKWWQSDRKIINELSYLNVVDFWQTRYFDNTSDLFKMELKNKYRYFSKLNPKNITAV